MYCKSIFTVVLLAVCAIATPTDPSSGNLDNTGNGNVGNGNANSIGSGNSIGNGNTVNSGSINVHGTPTAATPAATTVTLPGAPSATVTGTNGNGNDIGNGNTVGDDGSL